MKPGIEDGKTHPKEKTSVSSDGADNFSIHQPSADHEPTNKSKSPAEKLKPDGTAEA